MDRDPIVHDGNELLYDFKFRSDSTGLECLDPSKTVQADSIDADINVIVARYGLTGKMPESIRMPTYGDFVDAPSDYAQALAIVETADREFMTIPAEVRQQFNNDPGIFMQAVHDPANLPRLRELGLAKPLALEDTVVPDVKPTGDV